VKKYPDINRIIEKKQKHRRTLAALSFEQKIALVFKLSARNKFIKSGQVVKNARRPKIKL
jgi:DNA polymerase III sliding clamp (beta) subunit (PCNA family)